MLKRSILRTIKKSLGRYLAILAIIALGVGFFAGLRVAEKAMVKTADSYVKELCLYDYKLVSTLGLTEEDVAAFRGLDGVKAAMGSISADVLFVGKNGSDSVLHVHTLLDGLNRSDITAGRAPERDDECLLDAKLWDESMLGQKIVLSDNNPDDTRDDFTYGEYTVTGLANSPEYLNFERGTTALGNGTAAGFAYIPQGGFTADYFTEIYLKLAGDGEIYSDEYEKKVEDCRQSVEDLLETRATIRYDGLYRPAAEKIADAEQTLNDKTTALENGKKELESGRKQLATERQNAEDALRVGVDKLNAAKAQLDAQTEQLKATGSMLPESERQTAEQALAAAQTQYAESLARFEAEQKAAQDKLAAAQEKLDKNAAELADGEQALVDGKKELETAKADLAALKPAVTYTLDRSANVGYASFESDTAIVSDIAKVFPLFFLLVAALVCITTMTRMVSEQRTENGVLKALGFGNGAIIGQYLFYAGSASVIGCILGFLGGSRFLPMALWKVYHIAYSVERPIVFVPDWGLFALCSAVYLLCALGITWLVCRRDLRECAAGLIRPKAPTAGKRILLERVTFLWNRMKFLHKVTARNILRYKKRLVMMIIGIGGCTALLITGFGISDSIKPMIDNQFNEISLYDGTVSFTEGLNDADIAAFSALAAESTEKIAFIHTGSAEVSGKTEELNLVLFDEAPTDFINLHSGSKKLDWPQKDEAVINFRYADANGIRVGDEITLTDKEQNTVTVKVSGIFDNYVYDYAYVSAETYRAKLGTAPAVNSAYLIFKEDTDDHAAAAALIGSDNIAAVSLSSDMRTRVGSMLDSLDYIVLIVLVCAGALAFIVLYNLTNITITERTREIATLKVLGFYQAEQNAYVFRENIVLSAVGALCGIPMGIALLRYVMSQVQISNLYFGCRLSPISCLLAVLITALFTAVVDLTLTAKTKRINMAEAMKAIE